MPFPSERYLGDGLYASFDGFSITLRTPRENGDHWIGLEPCIWHELVRYQADCVNGNIVSQKID